MIQKLIQHNYTKGRAGSKITQITIHTAVSNATSLFGWFNTKRENGSSSHYYVSKEGKVEQYVKEEDTAWANSNGNSNRRSITIETWDGGNPNDKVRTDAMYNSTIGLVKEICKRYNIPAILLSKEESQTSKAGITQHRFYANKSCPAGLDLQRIIDGVNNFNNNDMTFLELCLKEREDLRGSWAVNNIDGWWDTHGYFELLKKLEDLKRTDVVFASDNSLNPKTFLKDWYFKHGSREYENIWLASLTKPVEEHQKTIEALRFQMEALELRITSVKDEWQEKYSQELMKAEMWQEKHDEILDKALEMEKDVETLIRKAREHQEEKRKLSMEIQALELKLEGCKEKGVESLTVMEVLRLALSKLLKRD